MYDIRSKYCPHCGNENIYDKNSKEPQKCGFCYKDFLEKKPKTASSAKNSSESYEMDSKPEQKQNLGVPPKPISEHDLHLGIAYKKGDFIGQNYEVYGLLGKGGFGGLTHTEDL